MNVERGRARVQADVRYFWNRVFRVAGACLYRALLRRIRRHFLFVPDSTYTPS